MTAVVYATYSEGYAYVYFRDDKGALTQTAQVLVASSEPAELTAIVAELADNLDWAKVVRSRNGHAPAQPAAPPAVKPTPTPKPVRADTKAALARHAPRQQRTRQEIESVDIRVLEAVRDSPGINIQELTEKLFDTLAQREQGFVRAALSRMVAKGAVIREVGVGQNEPHRYSVAVVGPLEPDRALESSAPDEASSPASAEAAEV